MSCSTDVVQNLVSKHDASVRTHFLISGVICLILSPNELTQQTMHQRSTTAADIGKAIKRRRKALNMTQDDLSHVAGVGRKFISSVENGKDTAQIGLILHLCQELGIEITLTSGGGYGQDQHSVENRSV